MPIRHIITGGYGVDNFILTNGYGSKNLGYIEEILKKMESVTIGTYVFAPDVIEPGLDNSDVPLRKILEKMK